MGKERNRDDEGNIITTAQPDIAEIIDPYVYQKLKRAVNYDITWNSQMSLDITDDEGNVIGKSEGCWTSRPFNRAYGKEMRAYLQELIDEGELENAQAFPFTHEEGKEAAEDYKKKVLQGKIKANMKSWGPFIDPRSGMVKSRYFRQITKEQAEQYGFNYREPQQFNNKNVPGGVWYEDLEAKYPELYERKSQTSSATYVKKADKIKMIEDAMEEMDDVTTLEDAINASARIAGRTSMTEGTVIDLLKNEIYGDRPPQEQQTVRRKKLSFDDQDETATSTDEQEREPSDDEIETAAIDAVDLEEDVEQLAEDLGVDRTAIASALVTATEETVTAETVERSIFSTDSCFENGEPHVLRFFDDAKLLTVSSTDYEGILVDGDVAYLFHEDEKLAGGVQQVLPEGLNLVGDAKTGEVHLFDVKKVPTS